MRAAPLRGLFALVATLALGAVPGACALDNVTQDACESTAECAALFGLGSVCTDGYCQDPSTCKTDAGCRVLFGYGARCQEGACLGTQHDARCELTEPPELVDALDRPIGDYELLGAIFRLDTPKEEARAAAARLAVREVNEQGGLLGKTLGLVVCDDSADAGSTSEATEALTRYLGLRLGVKGILGPSSSTNTSAALGLLLDERIPTAIVTPSATSSSLTNLVDRFEPETDPFGLLWRTCASDALQGKALAELIDGQQLKKPIVIFQRDTYGQGLEETFRIELTALGGNAASAPFDVDESDLASAVNASTGVANADALLVISNDAGRTLRVLAEVATHPELVPLPIFLTDGSKDQTVLLDPTQDQAVKDLVAKAQGTAPASPTTPEYQTFATNLKTQFGTDPEGFSFVANTYDATYAAVYALLFALDREDRSDGFDVAEGLSRLAEGQTVKVGPTAFTTGVAEMLGADKTLDLEGTSGHLTFDAVTGDTPADIEVWKVSADYAGFDVVTVIPY